MGYNWAGTARMLRVSRNEASIVPPDAAPSGPGGNGHRKCLRQMTPAVLSAATTKVICESTLPRRHRAKVSGIRLMTALGGSFRVAPDD